MPLLAINIRKRISPIMASKSEASNGSGSTNGNPLNLPDSASPSLTLDHPTEEERLGLWMKNSIMWKGSLSQKAYIRREYHLSSQDFTKDGGITWWVLVDGSAQERVILCACESFRKKALIFRNGETQEVITHGIGSVFCPPECRKRGYAQTMMKLMGEKLKTWQTSSEEKCVFSILYSDIGKVNFSVLNGWDLMLMMHSNSTPLMGGNLSTPHTSRFLQLRTQIARQMGTVRSTVTGHWKQDHSMPPIYQNFVPLMNN